MEYLGLGISIVALLISALTAWLTWFRRGQVRMTKPTVIAFLHEDSSDKTRPPHAKVFLRSLLYSTAYRGCVLEYLYVRLIRGEKAQNFAVWVYGDTTGSLNRGSGLFVGPQGVAQNHHFLLMDADEVDFRFTPGSYRLEVCGAIVGRHQQTLTSIELTLNEHQAKNLSGGSSIYFDWGPTSSMYAVHSRTPSPRESLEDAFLRYTKVIEKMADDGEQKPDTEEAIRT